MQQIKRIVKLLCPPILIEIGRRLRRQTPPPEHLAEWEYAPEGWQRQESDSKIKGWNVQDVLDTHLRKWPDFVEAVQGTSPLGVAHEANTIANQDYYAHNIMMVYAYVLATAARQKEELSVLDWGGGLAHYYLISKATVPGVTLDYHCVEVPLLAQAGQKLLAEVKFHDTEDYFDRTYDLVFASGSLQYNVDWKTALCKLAQSAREYLFITRTPIVQNAESFVSIQRAYQYGYNTEYLGWNFNQGALIETVQQQGFTLIREFLTEPALRIKNAPEQSQNRGYLFARSTTP
jgi:putative methyltransferase (TIGR04325 family)